jgi:hypothetical protein
VYGRGGLGSGANTDEYIRAFLRKNDLTVLCDIIFAWDASVGWKSCLYTGFLPQTELDALKITFTALGDWPRIYVVYVEVSGERKGLSMVV